MGKVRDKVTIATYPDDMAFLIPLKLLQKLQYSYNNNTIVFITGYLSGISKSTPKNPAMSLLQQEELNCQSVFVNGIAIPNDNIVKYSWLHLDTRLTWKAHIRPKRKQ